MPLSGPTLRVDVSGEVIRAAQDQSSDSHVPILVLRVDRNTQSRVMASTIVVIRSVNMVNAAHADWNVAKVTRPRGMLAVPAGEQRHHADHANHPHLTIGTCLCLVLIAAKPNDVSLGRRIATFSHWSRSLPCGATEYIKLPPHATSEVTLK